VIFIRSALFNLLLYLNLATLLLAASVTFFMPRWGILGMAKTWGRTSLWLLRVICDIKFEYRGVENITPGPLLVASKHQSLWETFALLPLFDDPAFILKRELLWIPFFGWYAWKAGMIPVNRGKRSQALADMTVCGLEELARGRQIVIFPEGTRRAPGAEPNYKYGIVHLYAETATTCLPIALNSGLFWPRRSFLRYPGTIMVEVLEPIAPGLDKKTFAEQLTQEIETATARLVAEGERELARNGLRKVSAATP